MELTLPVRKYIVSTQIGGDKLCTGGLLEIHGETNVDTTVTRTTNTATPGFILNASSTTIAEIKNGNGVVYAGLYLQEENIVKYGWITAIRIL